MISSNQINYLKELVRELGAEAERIKKRRFNYDHKKDGSPISEADKIVNSELNKYISKTNFKKVISEENKQVPFSVRKDWEYYWVVDPIDGTKEFINKGNDYTINIALCRNDSPIFGIVSRPASNDLYSAIIGHGSYKNGKKINVDTTRSNLVRIVASKSHIDAATMQYIEKVSKDNDIELVNIGSSLKICHIAEGLADIYPRFGPTMEWDTCAAHILLKEAGGQISKLNEEPLTYNKRTLKNPSFIAMKCN